MKKGKKRIVCTVFLVLNLCFIWGNSLLPAQISGAISLWLKGAIHQFFPGIAIGAPATGDHLLRKIAHFSEFTCLGLLFSFRFRLWKKPVLWALPCGVCSAAIDECIQIFVPGRGPGVKDVAIDSGGVLLGFLLSLLLIWLFSRRKT